LAREIHSLPSSFGFDVTCLRQITAWQASRRLHFVSIFVRLRRDKSAWQASDELHRASNEATLRAFRNADRFPTFKIFRRPGALFDDVSLQVNRGDRIGA
jgi:hypothetical protein